MGTLKAKTMIEKMGFSNKEKGSPEHDEIQLWLYNKVESIFNFNTLRFFEFPIYKYGHLYRGGSGDFDYNNKQIMGFCDLMVCHRDYYDSFNIEDHRLQDAEKWVFEIKPKINSIGELIRQINFYKSYIRNCKTIIVVSADDRYEKVLLNQKIGFIKYEDPW